jgi:hypothetical protein
VADVEDRAPVEAEVANLGGLVGFVVDGRLSGLEYWTVDDGPPAALPPLDRIRGQ